MFRFVSGSVCAALAVCVAAFASPAHAQRTIPPVTLSDTAECWYGELYGITSHICRDNDKLYRCTTPRTECWRAIPRGPYTRGNPRVNPYEGAMAPPTAPVRTRP